MDDQPPVLLPPPLETPTVEVESQPGSWGPAQAFAVFGVYLAAQLGSAFLVSLVGGIGLGFSAARRHEVLDPAAVQSAVFLPIVVVSVLVSSGGAFAFSLIRGRQRLWLGAPTGFGLVRADGRATLVFLLAGIALGSLFCFVAPLFVPLPPREAMGPLAQMAASPGLGRYVWLFIALLIAPPAEEYVFRGVLTSGLRARFGSVATIGVVTVVFTLMHATEALSYWPAFVSIAAFAVVAGVARERLGSLVPAVAAHFGYNLAIASLALAA